MTAKIPTKYPQPPIMACNDWGARAPRALAQLVQARPGPIVHHMDTPNRALATNQVDAVRLGRAIARQVQGTHMDTNGWIDTGNHFSVSRDGIILEGRHGTLAAIHAGHGQIPDGAHCADPSVDVYDNDHIGTEHEGEYDTAEMPKAQWEASVKLHAWLCDLYDWDTALIKGHRDTGISTDCPGVWFHNNLPKFRAAVHAELVAWRSKHAS